MVVAWVFYDRIFVLLTQPMQAILTKNHTKFLLTGFPEAFMIRMQICLVAGLILVSPIVTMQAWGFIAPGLTPNEKRPIKWIAPMSVALFLMGVVLCYLIMPFAFKWFAGYIPSNAELRPSVQASVLFTVKMLFAFGIAFELPVVLMLLAKVGIVNSRMLKGNWRYLIVAISIIAAVITPSNDAFSMLCMAIPLSALFVLSIYLVWLVEQDRTPWEWLASKFRRKRGK